ncbi:hypothetical protein [Streptomyces tendae]|uniref:hypothetical protein n=1 Tax=Streptomyces tendae TaxID=1932 RepID=UPI00372474F1
MIAQRAVAEGGTRPRRLRAVIAEWPLVVAALPTAWLLLGAVAEWWSEETAADVALLFNTISLLGLGISAARTAGLGVVGAGRDHGHACRGGDHRRVHPGGTAGRPQERNWPRTSDATCTNV